ncbi:MAG TPA: c-type cytochrome [Steroidobacteraceae bacterium]|jgi:cytochrome c1|nr:c-type cytochrome [Steroidobacteraceae bacterium]
MSRLSAPATLVAAAPLLLLLGGCRAGRYTSPAEIVPGGNSQAGARLIAAYRCGACHMIPGIKGADGLVGPPLILFARRTYVGGEVPNTPPNLVHWIMDPASIEPGTAMPALGLSEQQARDVAAYLYTLR